jgi:heme A synthase
VDILVTIHRFWGYCVLIAAVLGLVGAVAAWLGSLPPRQTARRAGLIYIIALDVQVLIGIVLLLVGYAAALPGGLKFEHPTTMVLAAVVAHAGQVMARRAKTPQAGARMLAIAIAVSFVLALLGVLRVTHAI